MRIRRLLSRFLLVGCILGVAVPSSFGQGGGERPARGGGGPGGPGGGRGMMGGAMGGGGMAALLAITEVRDELKMDDDQKKEYEAYGKEIAEETRGMFSGMFGGGGPGGGPGGPGGGAAGGAGGGGPGGGGRGGPGGAGMDRTKIQEAMASIQEKSETKLGDILDPVQMDRLVGLYIQRDGIRTLNSKTITTRLEITADQKAKIKEQQASAMEEFRAAMTPGAEPDAIEKLRTQGEKKMMDILTQAQKDKMESLKGAKFEFPAQPARGAGGRGGRGGAPTQQ